MKKCWVYLLAMILAVVLTAFGAAAEMERVKDVSVEENTLDIIPGEIEISDDALEILDETLDVEIPENEELQLKGPEMLELVDSDVTEDAVLVDNEEEQIAPVTEEPMMSDFEIDENGVLVKYNGQGGDVVIPDGVTEIGESAFAYCNNLTSVSIPNDVTSIGNYAFQGCESLKSVVLPKELSSFDRSVCLNSGVTSLTIQSDLILTDKTGLGGQTFNFDMNITEVVFAEGATRVDGYMFYGDWALKRVVLHDSVSIIGECAFCDCGLTEIALPKSLKTIGENAFDCCSSLTSISIASDISTTFNGVPLTKVVLGNGVTTVCDNMFSGCGSLTSVTLGMALQLFVIACSAAAAA